MKNVISIEIKLNFISESFIEEKLSNVSEKGYPGVKISVDQALNPRLDKLQA